MRDTIALRCVKCNHVHYYNSHFIEGVLKGMKKAKYLEVAKQMQEKRGPFYDKWLEAMEKRGEQKRCKDCSELRSWRGGLFKCGWSPTFKTVIPTWFACKSFIQVWRD